MVPAPLMESETTTSTGSAISTLRRAASSNSARALSTKSGSTSDLPISCPCARRNVFAIPPPISRTSTLGMRFSITAKFVGHFGATEDRDERSVGKVQQMLECRNLRDR